MTRLVSARSNVGNALVGWSPQLPLEHHRRFETRPVEESLSCQRTVRRHMILSPNSEQAGLPFHGLPPRADLARGALDAMRPTT